MTTIMFQNSEHDTEQEQDETTIIHSNVNQDIPFWQSPSNESFDTCDDMSMAYSSASSLSILGIPVQLPAVTHINQSNKAFKSTTTNVYNNTFDQYLKLSDHLATVAATAPYPSIQSALH